MKEDFYDMVYLYIDSIKYNIELKHSKALYDFADYLDKIKEKGWKIGDITEDDIEVYFNYLNSLRHKIDDVTYRINTIKGFMKFAREKD